MERRLDRAEVCIHDVEAVASVHQYFREPFWADDRIDNKRVPSWVWDGIRMVGLVEGYGRLRSPKERRRGQFGRIDLTARDLLAMFGVVGR